MTNRLSSLPIEPVFCLPFLAAVLLAATIVGSSVAAECNYTSTRENRTNTLRSPIAVSNCLFNQTISFSTTNATQALLPANVQFVNVTFGVLGTPVGPSFNDVPDFSTFTFQGCLFNSKICFNRTLLALRNITLRLTDVVFNAHGTVMVTSTIGISGIVLDARRITASLVGDTFQLTNGLFLFSSRSTAKVLPISDVSVTIADVEGTAVLGSSSVVGGTFIALLDVYTNLLTNITVDAQRVSWNTSGVCIESKLVALNAVSIFGPTTVTMDRITWNSWTFVFLATATTSNSLVAWGSDVMSGPTSVTLTKIHAHVRSEDPTVTVRPAAATASTGKVSIVRADRSTSTTTSIQYAGAFNVTIDNSILTGISAIRVNVIDFEFGTGPTLHVNLRVASTRTFLVVRGATPPITLQNVNAYVAGLLTSSSDIHRESTLMSLAGLSICASAVIVVQNVTHEAVVFFEANTNAALLEINPWMFTVVNLLSLANTTSLDLTVTDSTLRLSAASTQGTLLELCLVHGVIASVFQFTSTNAMTNCSMTLANVTVEFNANVTVATWLPNMQTTVAGFLGTDVMPSSVGVLAVTFATLLLDILCCQAGGDQSNGLYVMVSNVSTLLSLSETTTSASKASGGGVWASFIASGPVGKRAVLSGITIPLVANLLQEKFGTAQNRVNVLQNALLVMLNCSMVLDAPTTTWVDSILASGSDASPFTGVPPTGRRSSFGGFLFLGGSAFLPTGVRRSMNSVLPSPAVVDLGSVNASSVVWIESCSLTQVRSQTATAGTCVTNSFQPGQPGAAFMSLRWTTFYQVDGAAPTLIAVSNATMRAVVDGSSNSGATPMTLALLHSDYSSVSLSTSASAGVGAEFLFDNVVVHGPGATTSINSCRVASASSHPLALGWQALRFGFQSSTSLDPVHIQLKNVHVLQPANISQLRMFSAPLAWRPPLLSSALSSTVISVQCCSIDYVKPISAAVFAAPRWAIEVQPPPKDFATDEMCPYEGFWTSTLTVHDAPANAAVALDQRRPSKTTSTAVGATVVIVSGVASLVSSGVGTTAAAFATSTLAMRLQTSAAAIAMAVRCSVVQDEASDDDMAADLAIGSAVSDNPMQATIESFGPWTSAAGGAVLANAALVVAFGVGGPLVGVGIAAVWRGSDAANDDGHMYRLPSPLTLRSIGGFLLTLVPGQGATVYATLLQPTFASSIALLMAGNYPHVEVLESKTSGPIVLGVAALLLIALTAAAIVWSVLHAERIGRLRGVDHHAGTASSSIWSRWFGATEWRYAADRRSLHNKNSDDTTAFQRRFDSTYSGYRRSYLWFLACEWGVALLCGLLSALSTLPSMLNNPSACTGLVWGVAAVSMVLALCVLVLRPYSSKFDNTNNIVQCTSTAIVAVLAAALPSDDDAANDAANVVVILQTTLLALGAAIEIAHDVFASVRCFGAPTFQNTATQRGAARMGFRQSARSLNASFEFSYQICSVVEKKRESQATPWSSSVRQERVLQELISMICRVEQQQH